MRISTTPSDLGTGAHSVLEACLRSVYENTGGTVVLPEAYIGQSILIPADQLGDHSSRGPSGAKGWMNCGQHAQMKEKYPEEPQPERAVAFDRDYSNAVQVCLDFVAGVVTELRQKYDVIAVRAERKVSPKDFIGRDVCDGTSDITITGFDSAEIIPPTIHQVDFKAGAGVPVDVDDPQNELYLLGVCAEYYDPLSGTVPFRDAWVTICQPRCEKRDPRTRSRYIPDVNDWLQGFIPQVVDAVNRSFDPNAPFTPSKDACRWCPIGQQARYTKHVPCVAYTQYCLQDMGIDIGSPDKATDVFNAAVEFTLLDPELLGDDQITAILDIKEMTAGMFAAVEAHAESRLANGTAGPKLLAGYKRVQGRSNRRYIEKDDQGTVKRLKKIKFTDPDGALDKDGQPRVRTFKKAELYEQKLRSVASMEGQMKALNPSPIMWDAFKAAIEKPPGKITLVPRSDGREEVPALGLNAEEAFGDLPPDATQ